MKNYYSIILSIITLSAVVLLTLLWNGRFFYSLQNYRSPLAGATLPPQVDALPQHAQLVVVLISGLGDLDAQNLELPLLSQIARIGANAVIQSEPPTYSQTSRVALVSGSPPELNGASLIDLPVDELSPLETDTIFARAHDQQLSTALLGMDDWQRLIPQQHLDETFFVNVPGPETDQLLVESAMLLLKDDKIDLLFLQLTQLQYAAMFQGGPGSEAYRQAATNIETYLAEINKSVNYDNGVLVILGDHGHIEDGGFGGAEPEVARQPFIMIGSLVAPGNYSDIRQVDVAPTLSTLLGTAPPAAAQGRILFEMLRLTDKERALAQLALAQQRTALAGAYLAAVSDTPLETTDLLADLNRAQAAFAANNINGSFQLARLATETADARMLQARHNLINIARQPRLMVAVLVLIIWLLVMWRRRGMYAGVIIITAAMTVGLYHTLYQLQGFEYSISTFTNFADLPFSIARRTVVSMLAGGGLLLIILMLVGEKNWITMLGVVYGFSILVTFLFALPLFWTFWQNGMNIAGHVPSVDIIYWQITASYEALITAALGLFLPWPIMAMLLFVTFVRSALDKSQSQREADALPGLHL